MENLVFIIYFIFGGFGLHNFLFFSFPKGFSFFPKHCDMGNLVNFSKTKKEKLDEFTLNKHIFLKTSQFFCQKNH
jgi:hypothetical protein